MSKYSEQINLIRFRKSLNSTFDFLILKFTALKKKEIMLVAFSLIL